ncbi:MAG TPA: hypothetical protein DC009_07380 [Porphyromonadaceae bacterium]|nr:hypothetical protein [Porphyromonadaceae bacterium]
MRITTIARNKYDEFSRSHSGKTPAVVLAKIKWRDTAEEHEYFLSLDDCWLDTDNNEYRHTEEYGDLTEEQIFYHLESIDNLYSLCDVSCEDFVIKEIIGFY